MTIRLNKHPQAFSLVEILLTLVLILCLAAASVFTFTALYRTANLDEGNDRFQSLVRFAQAEAATTGRKVRLQFVPARPLSNSAPTEEKSDLRDIEVTWEADALNAPGVFQSYTNKAWSEDMVNELVGVEKVQPMSAQNSPSANSTAPNASGPETTNASEYPGVTFYPDGSCDSAEIVLASRNPEDARRVEVRLTGLLGSLSSRTLSSEEAESPDSLAAKDDFDALYDNPQPATSATTLNPSGPKTAMTVNTADSASF